MGRILCLLLLIQTSLAIGFIINNKLIRDDGVKVFSVSSEIKGYNCRCGCNCAAEGIVLSKPLPLPPPPFPNAPKQFHIQKHIKHNDCNCQCSCYKGQLPTEGRRIHSGHDEGDVHSEVTKRILEELKTTLSLPSEPTTPFPQSNFTLLKPLSKSRVPSKEITLETPLTVIVPERFTRPTRVDITAKDDTEETEKLRTTTPVDEKKVAEDKPSSISYTESTRPSEPVKSNTKVSVTDSPTVVVSDAGEKMTMVSKEKSKTTNSEATAPSSASTASSAVPTTPNTVELDVKSATTKDVDTIKSSSQSHLHEGSRTSEGSSSTNEASTTPESSSTISSSASSSLTPSTGLPGSPFSLGGNDSTKKGKKGKTTSIWSIVPTSAETTTTEEPTEPSSPSSTPTSKSTEVTTEDTNKLGLEIVSTTIKSNEEGGENGDHSILTTEDLEHLKTIPTEANQDGESTILHDTSGTTKTPKTGDDKMEKLKSILGKLKVKLDDMKKKKEEREDQAAEVEESIDNVATAVSAQEQYKQKVRELVKRLEAELERLKAKKKIEESITTTKDILSTSGNVEQEAIPGKTTVIENSPTARSGLTTLSPVEISVTSSEPQSTIPFQGVSKATDTFETSNEATETTKAAKATTSEVVRQKTEPEVKTNVITQITNEDVSSTITAQTEVNTRKSSEATSQPTTDKATTELKPEASTFAPTETPFRVESNDVVITEGTTLATTIEIASTSAEPSTVATLSGNGIEKAENHDETRLTQSSSEKDATEELSTTPNAEISSHSEDINSRPVTEKALDGTHSATSTSKPTSATTQEDRSSVKDTEGNPASTLSITTTPIESTPQKLNDVKQQSSTQTSDNAVATGFPVTSKENGITENTVTKSSSPTHLEDVLSAQSTSSSSKTSPTQFKNSSPSLTTTIPTSPFNPKEIPERETTEATVTTRSTTSEATTTFIPEKETAAPTTPKTTKTTLEPTTVAPLTTTTTETPVTKKISSEDSAGPSFVVADASRETTEKSSIATGSTTTVIQEIKPTITEATSTTTEEVTEKATEGLILTSADSTSTSTTSELQIETSQPSTSQPPSVFTTLTTIDNQDTTSVTQEAAESSKPKENISFSIDNSQQNVGKNDELTESPPFFADGLPGIAKLPKNVDEHTLMERHKEARRWREKLELEKLHENVEGQVKFQNPAERRRLIEEKLDQLAQLERYYHERLEQYRLAQRARANAVDEAPMAKPILTTSSTTTTTLAPTTLDPSLPAHCAPVVKFISAFHIDDPHEWLKGNCVFVKEYFPGASCSQIEDLLAVCFSS